MDELSFVPRLLICLSAPLAASEGVNSLTPQSWSAFILIKCVALARLSSTVGVASPARPDCLMNYTCVALLYECSPHALDMLPAPTFYILEYPAIIFYIYVLYGCF